MFDASTCKCIGLSLSRIRYFDSVSDFCETRSITWHTHKIYSFYLCSGGGCGFLWLVISHIPCLHRIMRCLLHSLTNVLWKFVHLIFVCVLVVNFSDSCVSYLGGEHWLLCFSNAHWIALIFVDLLIWIYVTRALHFIEHCSDWYLYSHLQER